MPATSKNEARFAVNLDSNASKVAGDADKSLGALRDSILKGQNAIKDMSTSMRSLRGNSDAVKAAKEDLKNKIQAERDAISASTVAILKQGSSLETLSKQEKDAKKEMATGPISELRGKFDELTESVGKEGFALEAMAGVAIAGVAALAALAAAVVAVTVKFASFVVQSAGVLRSMQLVRQASLGSAQNAANLGTHVDDLASKLSTPKDKINELASSLSRMRLSGVAIPATLEAVSRASDAMGDQVGSKLEDIITRGQQFGRMGIDFRELQGTGLELNDVAKKLSANLGITLQAAQTQLRQHAVKIDDGAKAIRDAVVARFGEINAAKLLDLGTQLDKFKEKLTALASGIHLDGLLEAISKFFSLFDDTTVTGVAIKSLVTDIGQGLVGTMTDSVPIAKSFVEGLVLGALKIEIAFFRVRNFMRDNFGPSFTAVGKNVDVLKVAMLTGKVIISSLATTLVVITGVFVALGAAVYAVVKPFLMIYDAATSLKDALVTGWDKIGSNLVDGLVGGITNAIPNAEKAIGGLADNVKAGFKDALGIHSPSKVFAGFGENTAKGFELGVEGGSDGADRALAAMAAPPASTSSSGSVGGGQGGGAPTISITIPITVSGGEAGAAKSLSDPTFLQNLKQAVSTAIANAGIAGAAT